MTSRPTDSDPPNLVFRCVPTEIGHKGRWTIVKKQGHGAMRVALLSPETLDDTSVIQPISDNFPKNTETQEMLDSIFTCLKDDDDALLPFACATGLKYKFGQTSTIWRDVDRDILVQTLLFLLVTDSVTLLLVFLPL